MEGGVLVRALEATRSVKPPGSPGFSQEVLRRERSCVPPPPGCLLQPPPPTAAEWGSEPRGTMQCSSLLLPKGSGKQAVLLGAETPGFSRSIPKGQVLGLPLAFSPDGLGQLCPPQLRSMGARPSAGTGVLRLISPDSTRQTSQDVFTWSGESLSLLAAPFYATTEQGGEPGQDACIVPGTLHTDW